MEQKNLLDYYQKMGVTYGSCKIKYEQGKNEIYKKSVEYISNWQKVNSFFIKENNGFYIVTGEKSNVTVIDIDNLQNEYAKYINAECDKCCNMKVQTKKGYHYYFKYNANLHTTSNKKMEVDCRNNNANIFCPPCHYKDENGNKFCYKFIRKPDNVVLNEIPKHIIDYYNNNGLEKELKAKLKENVKIVIPICEKIISNDADVNKINLVVTPHVKKLINDQKQHLQPLQDLLKEIVLSLNKDRNNNYTEWVELGMLLAKFDDYGKMLWKEFSKHCDNYNEKEIDYKYNTFNNIGGYTFFTLLFWLKNDNIDTFNLLMVKYKNLIEYINNVRTSKSIFAHKTFTGSKINMSMYLAKLFQDQLVCQSDKIYLWNSLLGLWEVVTTKRFSYVLVKFLGKILSDELSRLNALTGYFETDNKVQQEQIKKINFYEKKYGDDKYCEMLINSIYQSLLKGSPIEFDSDPHVVNFYNGIYNLKTSEFRNRVPTDYVTKYLPYDYSLPDPNIVKEIETKILNISNDDAELCEFNLNWFGYNLTGNTQLQKCSFIIGYSASNGKSSLAKMFNSSFPIYSAELDRSTFISGNTKSHKFLCDLDIPVRFAFVEELEQKNLDVNKIKNIISAKSFKNEVLYSTNKDIKLHAKITFISNFDPKFIADNGIKRRGLMQILTNRFVPVSEYEELKNEKGVYLRDDLFDAKFDKNEYKLALFHILAPYSKAYLETLNIKIPQKCTILFKDLCSDNDNLGSYISDYCDITKVDTDLIHKDEFIMDYNMVKNEKIKWTDIMSDIKKYVLYDRLKKYKNKRGFLVGIKFKEDLPDDLD